eukprot:TRINITY_DN32154_c0_g1_i1.p3 TRINITY_DN32154_c0_g1~~TRINITY_DN32154_c0_g1_i1.p3  ORF type:complete len:263 (+),score=58.82 TRINITY_DN32154_c0_g1_i1:1234-2022(+)
MRWCCWRDWARHRRSLRGLEGTAREAAGRVHRELSDGCRVLRESITSLARRVTSLRDECLLAANKAAPAASTGTCTSEVRKAGLSPTRRQEPGSSPAVRMEQLLCDHSGRLREAYDELALSQEQSQREVAAALRRLAADDQTLRYELQQGLAAGRAEAAELAARVGRVETALSALHRQLEAEAAAARAVGAQCQQGAEELRVLREAVAAQLGAREARPAPASANPTGGLSSRAASPRRGPPQRQRAAGSEMLLLLGAHADPG